MAICSKPGPVAWTNLVHAPTAIGYPSRRADACSSDASGSFSVVTCLPRSLTSSLLLSNYFDVPARCERDSMPPEMFRALNPFCRRIRVA